MTKILFEDISPGEKIEIKGPIGRFTLPENIDRDIFNLYRYRFGTI